MYASLLYILPKFRRRGYVSELEKEMSRRTLAKGYIPFGQVEVDNEASIKLQESMGHTKSENTVMWMWKEK
ncbi:MAG: GNAT family N-acetyltransferase [Pseudobutyrivibrio sp.]|nr:GNAT family N-acetyltransferase [Pseudobutyrivibrio sp.]